MSKKTKPKGVPRSKPLSWAAIEQLKKDKKELSTMLNSIAYRTAFTRDVLEEAGRELQKRGKMTPAIANVLKVQIVTMDNVLINIMAVPINALADLKKNRDKAEFDKAVEATCDEAAPSVIIPVGSVKYPKKGGSFII